MSVALHSSPIQTPVSLLPSQPIEFTIQLHLTACLSWTPSQPNAEPLWSAIRIAATNYLMGLFVEGKLMGTSPSQAFFVKCDRTTTTQLDIDSNIANLLVGFAPTKPAEFTMIRLALHTAPTNP
jgi:hypothetical protein